MLLTSLGDSPSACLRCWPWGRVTASSISFSCASICSLVGRAARAELVGVGVGIAEQRDSGTRSAFAAFAVIRPSLVLWGRGDGAPLALAFFVRYLKSDDHPLRDLLFLPRFLLGASIHLDCGWRVARSA